ncbi:MAG TPA: VWA domain-containing protein [Bryobacteraceae bacterium]|nr:VWA domain-containing protein [Bryobacteraceae bacterium]
MRLLLSLALSLSALSAQQPPEPDIKVDVNLVNVAFIVRDSSGELSGNLTRDDIDVFEDGVKQDIRFFGRSADLPLRLALIADFSGSQEKFVKQHNKDIGKFLRSSLTSKDRAMMVCFGNHIRVVSDFASSPEDLMEGLNEFGKGSRRFPELDPDDTREAGTALFDAIYVTAAQKLRPQAGERKAIVLFSDGEDNSSAHDLIDAIDAAQLADSLIYTVRYTETMHGRLTARNRYGIREMDRLAGETGGASFDASRKDVGDSLRQVSEELRSMYDLGYITSNPTRDKTFRKVIIRAKRPGFTVRAKPGYYAR